MIRETIRSARGHVRLLDDYRDEGQTLVEYALIGLLVLLFVAGTAALITGPLDGFYSAIGTQI